jgi:hypothetical protein
MSHACVTDVQRSMERSHDTHLNALADAIASRARKAQIP